MTIPIIVSRRSDELYFSWIIRLANANGVSSPYFMEAFGWSNLYKHECAEYLSAGSEELITLFRNLNIKQDPGELFLSCSLYGGLAFMMTNGQQIKLLAEAFNPVLVGKGLAEMDKPVHSDLLYCPQCDQQNGEIIFRTTRQMPGMRCCPDCGKQLLTITVDRRNFYKPFQYTANASTQNMLEYAKFAVDILRSRPDASLNETKAVLLNELINRGYKDNPDGLKNDICKAGLKNLFTEEPQKIFKQLSLKAAIPYKDCLGLIFFLWRNTNDFLKELAHFTRKPEKVDEGYIIIGKEHNILTHYVHTACKTSFWMTPHGFSMGFRCPACDRDKPADEIFKNIVSLTGKENYEPLSPFNGLSRRIPVKHSCGSVKMITPYRFIYYGIRCKCEYQLSDEEINERLQKVGDFTLISRNGFNVILRHGKCKNEFPCYLSNFLKFPFCRSCLENAKKHPRITAPPKWMKILAPSKLGYDKYGRMNAIGLYWKILCDKHKNELIQISDYVIPPYTQKNISDRFAILKKQGILKFLIDGTYCLSESDLTVNDVIRIRYLYDKDRVFGYFAAASFASSLGLLNNAPSVKYITTNVLTDYDRIAFKGYGGKLELIRPKTEINNQNAKVLQLLDLLISLKRYSDYPYRDTLLILHNYAKKVKITVETAKPYLQFYPPIVARRLQELLNVPAKPKWK